MKKNIFAVCDLEVDYALNFMDYLNHKKDIINTGVTIKEYEGGISYHGKSMTIDDDIIAWQFHIAVFLNIRTAVVGVCLIKAVLQIEVRVVL